MVWEKFDSGIMQNVKKNGKISFKIQRWNSIKKENEYLILEPPESMNKVEVKAWVRDKRLDFVKQLQLNSGVVSPKITFGSYFNEVYLKKQLNIKPRTLQGYLQLYHNHIKGKLGNVELVEINSIMLSTMQSEWENDGVGTATRGSIHRLVRLVLQYAYEDRIILANPAMCRGIAPKQQKKKQSVLVAEQVTQILEEADKELPIWRVLTYMTVFTGCRRGEIAGLTWENVELEGNYPHIHICQNVVVVSGCDEKIGTPKTDSSIRDLPIYEPLVSMLREYKAISGERGFVFKNFCDPNQPINPDTITKHLRALGKRCGIDCSPHTFRRSLASILDRNNIPIKNTQEIMGHSSPSVTSEYYVSKNYQDREYGMRSFYDAILEEQCDTVQK